MKLSRTSVAEIFISTVKYYLKVHRDLKDVKKIPTISFGLKAPRYNTHLVGGTFLSIVNVKLCILFHIFLN